MPNKGRIKKVHRPKPFYSFDGSIVKTTIRVQVFLCYFVLHSLRLVQSGKVKLLCTGVRVRALFGAIFCLVPGSRVPPLVTLQWTSTPSRGDVETLLLYHFTDTGDKRSPDGPVSSVERILNASLSNLVKAERQTK